MDEDDDEDIEDEAFKLNNDVKEDEINALNRTRMHRREVEKRARRPGAPAKSAARKAMCGNCFKEGHGIRDCKEPKVSLAERTCFFCKKNGHISFDCQDRRKG